MPLGRYIPGGICCMFQHSEKYLHDVVSVPLMIFAHRPVSKMADFSPREVAFRSSGCLALVLGRTKAGPPEDQGRGIRCDASCFMQADGNFAYRWARLLIYKELCGALRIRVMPCAFVWDVMSPMLCTCM